MKKSIVSVVLVVLALGVGLLWWLNPAPAPVGASQAESQKDLTGKRILLINSYHPGYEWSDGIVEGARKTLGGTGIELEVVCMDTKRNTSEAFCRQAAERVRERIEQYRPDLVISADDNAFKYVIAEYYRDVDLPVVFCGINWDASEYGAPYTNTTGMLEVGLPCRTVEYLSRYAKGDRIGYMGGDVLTARKEAFHYKRILGREIDARFAKDFEQWKRKYVELQQTCDMVIFYNNAGIAGWDHDEAVRFVMANTKVVTGATLMHHMAPYAVITLVRRPQEQGEWSAQSAIEILRGRAPSDIPVTRNKQGELYLNLDLAEKLGIVFPPAMIRSAGIVGDLGD